MLTHQGRSSSSGHYLAWIRRKGGNSVHCSLSDTQSSQSAMFEHYPGILPAFLTNLLQRESKRPEDVACILLTQTTKCKAHFFQTSYNSEHFSPRFSVLYTKDYWVHYKEALRKYSILFSCLPFNDPWDKTNYRETRKIIILDALHCRWVGKVRWWQDVQHHNRADFETLWWRYVV